MAGIQLSNLINGSFDWHSIIDQLLKVDGTPITTLQNQEATNNNKLASLSQLQSGFTQLQSAATALKADGLFTGRIASTSTASSGWTMQAADGAAIGNHVISVSHLASAAAKNGAADISLGLSATTDVSGLTLATLPTATAVTAGNFTVDGKTVTVALTDSLANVFQKISDATSGVVTASYNPSTDGITLASSDASEVILGAGNDTSNFLNVMKLANNSSSSVSSRSALGSVALNSPLVSARLRSAVTAVDGSGNGAFTVNGVSIAYNINTDSLSTVMRRINASTAGVTASYDAANDKMVLTNNVTGDTGLGANEGAGGLLSALGLGSGATFVHGTNAAFTVDGGQTRTALSNSLTAADLGIVGLSATVNTEDSQTISVTADTGSMQSAIQTFLNSFNVVQTFVDSQTSISTSAAGAVSTSTLSSDHDVQDWTRALRGLAFNAVSGLSGTIKQLDNLGIDFTGTGSTLSVKDSAKLSAALANNSGDVAAFFTTATTGFADKFNSYLTQALSTTGGLTAQTTTLKNENTSLTAQIAVLNTRLADEKQQLTTAFLAMQNAQSVASQQSSLLTQTFSSTSK